MNNASIKKFYGFADSMNPYGGMSSKFESTIDDIVLNGGDEYGDILEFDNSGDVPVHVATYPVNKIELYELSEFLEDNPEMNENNYIVYTDGSNPDQPDMLIIVQLGDKINE